MFENIIRQIETFDTIILHRHKNPDGDALGSQIGLKQVLRANYPDKRIFCVGDPAGRYSFMEESVMDDVPDSIYKNALAVILDTPSKNMISDERYCLAKKTARIDHHIFCEKIADDEVVNTAYESCCGLVTEMVIQAGWTLDEHSARSLYTGMITDSGRFRYDSVSERTFICASVLMRHKFNTADLYRNLYADDYSFLKLRAKFILKINFSNNGNVAYIYTTKKEEEEYGADPYMLSRAMVNVMSDIRGVDAWVNFTESPDGILAELRSSLYEIHPIAKKYGGGGHAKACGATLKNREDAMRMIEDIEKLLEEQK